MRFKPPRLVIVVAALVFGLLALVWFLTTSCAHRAPRANTQPRPPSSEEQARRSALSRASAEAYWDAPLPAASTENDFVWWEAERPLSTDYPKTHPFVPADAREADLLSGAAWIGVDAPASPRFLEYEVSVSGAGRYDFYARKFWKHGPFRFRFDDQPWRHVPREVALLDAVVIRKNVSANWVLAGQVELAAGKHRLRIELVDPHKAVAAWDAFLLTTKPFAPRGKLRPGARSGSNRPGWFAFEPDADTFGQAELDLRNLNESVAGEAGFLSAQGDALVQGPTKRPVRLWGVNVSHPVLALSEGSMAYLAKALAKRGVNFVRIHGGLARDDDGAVLDASKLERLALLVASFKEQGIYTALSLYSPLWVEPKDLGVPGYDSGDKSFSLVYFEPAVEGALRGWWKQILLLKNPRTGSPLSREPALAAIELVNEDSTLFWSFKPYETIPEPTMLLLERKFGAWLAERHGSVQAALARWGGQAVRGDDAERGRVGFLSISELAQAPSPRSRETAEFLARVMRSFYERSREYLKRDLGYGGLVIASNWVTANPRTLGPLDKWANFAGDLMDRHGYYGGPHQGERAKYLVAGGDRYDDASALRFDPDSAEDPEPRYRLPIADYEYAGKPSLVSEINWPTPNRFRAELPILAAAYGALLGTDAYAFYAVDMPSWVSTMPKFSVSDPALLGGFPAAAALYRLGLVRASEPVRRLDLPGDQLFALTGLPEPDPLLLLTGPVRVGLEAPRSDRTPATPGSIDRAAKVVRSSTGELDWNFGRGIARIDSTAAQGVVGFLDGGPHRLRDIEIETRLPYGVVLVVSLDGLPLANSRRMLVQVMSEVTHTDWRAPGEGVRAIRDLGRPPLLVRELSGSVRFNRADRSHLRAAALDPNGYSFRRAKSVEGGLALLPDVLYYSVWVDP